MVDEPAAELVGPFREVDRAGHEYGWDFTPDKGGRQISPVRAFLRAVFQNHGGRVGDPEVGKWRADVIL